MKIMHKFMFGLFLATLFLIVGCISTMKISYDPTYTASYSNIKKIPVSIASVSDKRSAMPMVYYQNSKNGDTGQFDRPIIDIVREAITAEFQRAGLGITDDKECTVIINCDVLDLRAVITEPFFRSAVLDLTVAIRFEWLDAKSKDVIATHEQSERRSRKIGYHVPELPFDEVIIQDYGNELINDMLVRVIEKELNSVPFLN